MGTADYLVKNKYTIADVASYGWVRASWMIQIDLEKEFPALNAWKERIAAREAVQKGQEVGVSKPLDEMKEMFKGVSAFIHTRCETIADDDDDSFQMREKVAAMDNSDKH